MPVAQTNGKTVLFIHIPKTAGMSIDRFLRANGKVTAAERLTAYGRRVRLRHLHAEPLQELYLPGCFDWCFMIVRHPEQKLISEYRYHRRRGGLRPQNFMSFSVWLRYSFARAHLNPSYRENHFRPQTEFRAFDAEVFRLEDGLSQVEARFGTVTDLGGQLASISRENVSPPTPVVVSELDRALINSRYAADYEAFGYDPSGAFV